MLVSFIIPSYNSASTVKRCLDSIYALPLEQSEFELIFVDDCSTDNTVEEVKNYCPENYEGVDNLILLHQVQNNRQGAARNRGLSIAKGEYICFVDSDDIVAEGMVSAIRLAEKLQTGYVVCHRDGSTTHSNSYKNYADYLLLGTRMLALYTTIQRDIDRRDVDSRIDQLRSKASGFLKTHLLCRQ